MDIVFEKVSYEQFAAATRQCMGDVEDAEFAEASETIKTLYNEIKLPTRATEGSAGYDFYFPFASLELQPDEIAFIPTGIRCKMPKGTVLMLFPRSSVGFKTGTYLANTTGVIDSDYYYADNEGHIMVKLVGGFAEYKAGHNDRFIQGVFFPYCVGEDQPLSAERVGGFGSTGK